MVKNKRIRKRKFYTQWDKKAKMMSRGFGQRQKQKVFYSQWAGFECPKCHQTSTEYDGYLFGGVGFKCYSCDLRFELPSLNYLHTALHSKPHVY